MHRFTVVSREGCELCEEMLLALERFCADRDADIGVIDVDADPALQLRYGHRVPVLLLDDEPVCHGHFDAGEVERLIRQR